MIRNVLRENAEIEADYAWVYFSLNAPKTLTAPPYVYGAFNNFELSDTNKLSYNSKNQLWECPIYLKQGFYNYTFALKEETEKLTFTALTEVFDTENSYTILVYHQLSGERLPKLIGTKTLHINQIRQD